jgi:transposase
MYFLLHALFPSAKQSFVAPLCGRIF